jgi:hypothetical protein
MEKMVNDEDDWPNSNDGDEGWGDYDDEEDVDMTQEAP